MLSFTDMLLPDSSVLYEINTPLYLHKLSSTYGYDVKLDNIPDEAVRRLADLGIRAVWLMGVWQRSPYAVAIGNDDASLQAHLNDILPDYTTDDHIGSAYSIQDYRVNDNFGGDAALALFRAQLQDHGLKLILDFVPNHTAPDHPWAANRPDYYITGTAEDLAGAPDSFIESHGSYYANGRDPQFPPWSDVIQLNAFSPGYRQAATDTLQSIADRADGVRCDMAMLLQNDIFAGTWGERAGEMPATDFWTEIIPRVRAEHPDFIFMAEAYWDTEEALLDQGFDYCYDKTFYDVLLEQDASSIIAHLGKTRDYQKHLVRFIENHDEPRAAAVYPVAKKQAAAAIIATLPGLWLFHDGQMEGYRTKVPVHLGRGPQEPVNTELHNFYAALFAIVSKWQYEEAGWQLLSGDNSHVVAWQWVKDDEQHAVVVNYTDQAATTCIQFSTAGLHLMDEFTSQPHETIKDATLTLDLSPWQIVLLTKP